MGKGGQFTRLGEAGRRGVAIEVDGQPVAGMEGDTVLTVLLTAGRRLRDNEFERRPRAGFCLMGACQDCWLWRPDGGRVRACSTPVAEGMVLLTRSPLEQWTRPNNG
ncbi:2Fe-2S iron-sulfur cluster protein [Stella humosa]|uniref:2Fe-2S iron-sulfur cluster protein n=1 Tax=Stella humosa TaxID=94 RepID=A0A3N1MJT1_9PROT|nr:(2Fe-2S)-binding protein [Stella humosa]ROQ01256.1 2Fe-2S iron-sulfur cluster protein [Stella humosa]BBK31630.1 NAD(FAD)-dependent dehydrogenase [Stella humosa]